MKNLKTIRRIVTTTAAGTLVAGVATVAAVTATSSGSSNAASQPTTHSKVRAVDATVSVGLPGNQTCNALALPTLPSTLDPRIIADTLQSGWAQLISDTSQWLDLVGAGSIARSISSATDATTAPAAAVEVPASTAEGWFGDLTNTLTSLINPQRCVWVVTVDAPWTPASTPYGATVHQYDSYTVVYDAASGDEIDFGAGQGIPDMLTGANLGG